MATVILLATAGVAGAAFAARLALRAYQRLPGGAAGGGAVLRQHYVGGFEPTMSKSEAALILGVRRSASIKKIKEKHRKLRAVACGCLCWCADERDRLMVANHPDAGGSPLIAQKVNQAKELLLKDVEPSASGESTWEVLFLSDPLFHQTNSKSDNDCNVHTHAASLPPSKEVAGVDHRQRLRQLAVEHVHQVPSSASPGRNRYGMRRRFKRWRRRRRPSSSTSSSQRSWGWNRPRQRHAAQPAIIRQPGPIRHLHCSSRRPHPCVLHLHG